MPGGSRWASSGFRSVLVISWVKKLDWMETSGCVAVSALEINYGPQCVSVRLPRVCSLLSLVMRGRFASRQLPARSSLVVGGCSCLKVLVRELASVRGRSLKGRGEGVHSFWAWCTKAL